MDFGGSGGSNQLNNLATRGPPDNGIVDEYNSLIFKEFLDGVELDFDAEMADGLFSVQ